MLTPYSVLECPLIFARLPIRGKRPPFKQCRWLNIEHLSELFDHRDTGGIKPALKGADVSSVYTGFMRQRFLRQSLLPANPAKVAGKGLSDLHAREAIRLSSILPRSILHKK